MQYRTDAKSGKELSILGFGCMRFPMDSGKTEKLILSAIEAGVNYFDTAYIYGNSEVTLGGILSRNDVRNKIYLATKLPFSKCRTYDDFDKIFNTQLERLKTDYIDYYLIHNMSDVDAWRDLCDKGIEKWIAGKKAGGQIRHIGFSFHGSRDIFLSLLDMYDWDFCQIQYNYMDENYQAGRAGLKRAYEKGIPVIVMEPLLGGKLATGLPPKAARHFTDTGDTGSLASWALRWLWNQPEVTVVLSGMNSFVQLDDNLKTASDAKPGMLTERQAAAFTPVVQALREAYKVNCTGCGYCIPCPQGLSIPDCFAAYNTSYAMGYFSGIMLYLTSIGVNNPRKGCSVKQCIKCGVCEKKCPQGIKISQVMPDVARRLEPAWVGAALWVARKIMK